MNNRHKTFISYHHANDEQYKIAFKNIFADIHDIIVPWDVEIGDIDPNQIIDVISGAVSQGFVRRDFEEFNYIKILPDTYSIIVTGILSLLVCIGTGYFVVRNEIDE